MANVHIRSARSRLVRSGLKICVSLVAVIIVYVASIGPLAFLESQGLAADGTWKQLRSTVYHPVYHAWWHGPKWLDSWLERYVGCFELTSRKAKRFGAESNHCCYLVVVTQRKFERREQKQLEWDKAHPVEGAAREAREESVDLQGGYWCSRVPTFTKAEQEEAENSWWHSILYWNRQEI